MTRQAFIALCAACLAFLSCTCDRRHRAQAPARQSAEQAVVERPKLRSPVGTNLTGITDWNTELPFVDLFKTSREWISGSGGEWDDERALDIDEHGWVRSLKNGQIARTLMLWNVEHYPEGQYVVLYEGEGSLAYERNDSSTIPIVERRPGRHVLRLGPSTGAPGIQLMVTKTNPQNPVRNIRVLLPGAEKTHSSQIFNPAFLDRIKNYSVLRFMDWLGTNDSQIASWDERPKVDDARWSIKGVPLEVMVRLANQMKAEPWFNMPHRADDDYVRRFASEVRASLDEDLRVWVEFSNEVWNGRFEQHEETARCDSQRGADDSYSAALLCYSERAVEVGQLWHSVFADDKVRVVRILASHSDNPWASEQIVNHKKAYRFADALAIAPYFGLIAAEEDEARVENMSLDALVRETDRVLIPETIDSVKKQAAIAKKRGLDLVAYEGGQHFVGVGHVENNEKINELYDAINRDPRIGLSYKAYLQGWKQAGGALFVHYTSCDSYSKWGRFGALEHVGQPREQAPKFDAIQRFIEQNPP